MECRYDPLDDSDGQHPSCECSAAERLAVLTFKGHGGAIERCRVFQWVRKQQKHPAGQPHHSQLGQAPAHRQALMEHLRGGVRSPLQCDWHSEAFHLHGKLVSRGPVLTSLPRPHPGTATMWVSGHLRLNSCLDARVTLA